MNPQLVLNVLVLVAVLVLVIWFPDRVSLIPMILGRSGKKKKKPAGGTAERAAVPQPAKLPEVDPNKTVVMPPRDRPGGR